MLAYSNLQCASTVHRTTTGSCTESACTLSDTPGASVPTCRWVRILPAMSGLECSSLQRECTEFPYAILLLIGTAIVQKEECFAECTKPPVLRQAKPGAQAQYVIFLIETRNPNPFPIGNKFGFFLYGGQYRTRLYYGAPVVEPRGGNTPPGCCNGLVRVLCHQ